MTIVRYEGRSPGQRSLLLPVRMPNPVVVFAMKPLFQLNLLLSSLKYGRLQSRNKIRSRRFLLSSFHRASSSPWDVLNLLLCDYVSELALIKHTDSFAFIAASYKKILHGSVLLLRLCRSDTRNSSPINLLNLIPQLPVILLLVLRLSSVSIWLHTDTIWGLNIIATWSEALMQDLGNVWC